MTETAKLVLRSLAGLAFLWTMLGAGLFFAAGTFDYPQAWRFLAAFAGCTLFVTVYLMIYDRGLLERRVQAGPTAETQRTQKIIHSLASLCFVALFVVAGLDRRWQWSAVPEALHWIGLAAVVVGFAIVFATFRANSFTSAVIEVAADQRLISTGPYAVVRHPMYAGAAVLLLGAPLALGSWPALACSVGVVAVVAVRAVEEEKYLAVNLPGYADYRRRVRWRIVPLLW